MECPLGDFFACGWGQYAQVRRVNPLPYKQNYTILDGICGRGQYVGTYMVWGVNNTGWWGEGEIKFYMDGDREYPTICGTGTEDYFCGSYNFENPQTHQYQTFTTPYSGLCQVIRPDGVYASQTRFGLYRWHIADPVYFAEELRVTIQALGWRSGGRYLPLQDDIASVAYFYLDRPACALPPPRFSRRAGNHLICDEKASVSRKREADAFLSKEAVIWASGGRSPRPWSHWRRSARRRRWDRPHGRFF